MGGGELSNRGIGASDSSSPSSLPLFFMEVGEAYSSGVAGGEGQDRHPPHTHHFSLLNVYIAYFVAVKP